MKTINRRGLATKVRKGLVVAKCEMHLTDDYAFDNAYGFGKTDWMPAHLMTSSPAKYVPAHLGQIDWDRREGCLNLYPHDFEGKSGSAYQDDDGLIHLRVHSNLHYVMRIVDKPVKPRIRRYANVVAA